MTTLGLRLTGTLCLVATMGALSAARSSGFQDDELASDSAAAFQWQGKTVTSMAYLHIVAKIDLGALLVTHSRLQYQAEDGAARLARRIDGQNDEGRYAQRARRIMSESRSALLRTTTALEALGIGPDRQDELLQRYNHSTLGDVLQKFETLSHRREATRRDRRSTDDLTDDEVAALLDREARAAGPLLFFLAKTVFTGIKFHRIETGIKANRRNIATMGVQVNGNSIAINALRLQHSKMAERVGRIERHIVDGETIGAIDDTVDYLKEQSSTLLSIAGDLKRGKLNEQLLTTQTLQASFFDLKQLAAQTNRALLAEEYADLLQFEVGFYVTHDLELVIVVRVPTRALEDELQVYRFISLPFVVEKTTGLLASISTPLPIIAGDFGTKRRFRATTMEALLQCTRTGEFFLCPGGNINRLPVDDDETSAEACTWGLFTQDYDAILRSCDFKLHLPDARVEAIGDNAYVGFDGKEEQATIRCLDGDHDDTFSVSARFRFSLAAGCTAQWSSHIVHSDDILQPTARLEAWGWPRTVHETFGLSQGELRQLAVQHRERLRTTGISRGELLEISAENTRRSNMRILAYFASAGSALFLLALILTLAVCYSKPLWVLRRGGKLILRATEAAGLALVQAADHARTKKKKKNTLPTKNLKQDQEQRAGMSLTAETDIDD